MLPLAARERIFDNSFLQTDVSRGLVSEMVAFQKTGPDQRESHWYRPFWRTLQSSRSPGAAARTSMATRPAISVIIAAYNRGPLIARTLDSVLNQTRPADEILVVDDCSPDGTGNWVRARYPQVRVVRTESNLFTSGARNFGARHASGDLLIFLDHDDELMPHAVEALLELRAAFPEAGAVFTDHASLNRVTGISLPDHHTAETAFHRLRTIPVLREAAGARLYGRALYHALLRGNLLQRPWAVDTALFHRLGGFAPDVRYCEDWDMYLRVTRAFLVVVSDIVISRHITEGGNLHLTPNQSAMHMRVIERRLREDRFRDPAAAWVLSRRLANYLKRQGDQARRTDPAGALRRYLHSLYYWPFDHIVAARSLIWSWSMLVGWK